MCDFLSFAWRHAIRADVTRASSLPRERAHSFCPRWRSRCGCGDADVCCFVFNGTTERPGACFVVRSPRECAPFPEAVTPHPGADLVFSRGGASLENEAAGRTRRESVQSARQTRPRPRARSQSAAGAVARREPKLPQAKPQPRAGKTARKRPPPGAGAAGSSPAPNDFRCAQR